MACSGPDTKYAEPMQAHYHMLLDYMGWKERGSVLALGMLQAGAVKTSPPSANKHTSSDVHFEGDFFGSFRTQEKTHGLS